MPKYKGYKTCVCGVDYGVRQHKCTNRNCGHDFLVVAKQKKEELRQKLKANGANQTGRNDYHLLDAIDEKVINITNYFCLIVCF